jgi:hypothetical protein
VVAHSPYDWSSTALGIGGLALYGRADDRQPQQRATLSILSRGALPMNKMNDRTRTARPLILSSRDIRPLPAERVVISFTKNTGIAEMNAFCWMMHCVNSNFYNTTSSLLHGELLVLQKVVRPTIHHTASIVKGSGSSLKKKYSKEDKKN